MRYLEDFAKNFSFLPGFFFDGTPGLRAPDPRPPFCRQKGGGKTASPQGWGLDPEPYEGVLRGVLCGGFLKAKPPNEKRPPEGLAIDPLRLPAFQNESPCQKDAPPVPRPKNASKLQSQS